jgi:hypothetical protein
MTFTIRATDVPDEVTRSAILRPLAVYNEDMKKTP